MWLTLLIVSLISLYLYLNHKLKYWQRFDIKCAKPTLYFGNLGPVIFGKKNLGQLYTSIYQQFKNESYVGFYKMSKPGLIIRDVGLAKDILTKDFDCFAKNDLDIDEDLDPLFAKNPFVLVGDKWKHTRGLVTPAFSSGKMKLMFGLIEKTTQSMISFIESKMDKTLEAKELSAHFTTDNVATCAFGLEANSFKDEKSEFREMGRQIFNQTFVSNIKMTIAFFEPFFAKWLRIRLVPEEANDYFLSVVSQTLKYRAENNIIRKDFLDMMQQVKLKAGPDFTDVDVAAHAIGFFIDGFETSATTMCFVLYNIAKNADVQTKLRRNIVETIEKTGVCSYEAVQDMDYLDMVISESMRLYPAIYMLLKICTKTYNLPPTNSRSDGLIVPVGTPIVLPAFGYQTDEKYFADPLKYDPERFSDENKRNIEKCSFLPFGEGPRACLGQRFGLMQVKLGVVSIVREFMLSVNEKTIEPLVIDPKIFLTAAVGGIWLNFKKI